MRTYLLFTFFIILAGSTYGQISFSDDFEEYNVGDLIASTSADWSTWSGETGGPEDAAVSNDFASSGSNSLLLQGGGTTDIILPFGGIYDSGYFTLSFNIYVPAGNGAYMNVQGLDVVGQGIGIWDFQAYFEANGDFTMENTNFQEITASTYTQGEWINVSFEINLESNSWNMFINKECAAAWTNSNGSVASMNLFPRDASDIFYIDDVTFEHTLTTPFTLDAAVAPTSADPIGLADTEQAIELVVSNGGTQTITSYTIDITNNGVTQSQDFTTDLAAGASEVPALNSGVQLNAGNNDVTISISNINGQGGDEYDCNNSSSVTFNGVQPAEHKNVWVEEATGTWCQFCPRGDVFMNALDRKYGERFVGIAVHNVNPNYPFPDPMLLPFWDAGVTDFPGFTGFPNVIMNRGIVTDPSLMEAPFIESIQEQTFIYMEHGAKFDDVTRELEISVSTNFILPITDGVRLVVGLTEDGVSGTDPGYAQVNAFSGGTTVMGGYENRPDPVPAEDMIYNHVARHLFTDFEGMTNAFDPDNTAAGDVVTHQFSVVVPDDFNTDNMHIVSAFRLNNGVVHNSKSTKLVDAIASGLVSTIDLELDAAISVSPNPTNGVANVTLEFDSPTQVNMSIGDAMGRIIAQKNIGTVTGQQTVQFDTSVFGAGIYYLRFRSGNVFTTKKLIVTD